MCSHPKYSATTGSSRVTSHLANANRGANPAYTAEELEYQLGATKARVLISHPGSLPIALEAAQKAGIAHDRVVVFDETPGVKNVTLDALIKEGLSQPQAFVEPRLAPGEGRTKLAFLSFSSGTTGRPKVCLLYTRAP